jgi:hypothetical protein
MPLVEGLMAEQPDLPPPAREETYELHDSRVAGR